MKKLLILTALPFILASCGDLDGLGQDSSAPIEASSMPAEESLNDTASKPVEAPLSVVETPDESQANLIYGGPKYHIGTPYKIEDVQYNPAEDWQYDQSGTAGIVPIDLNGVATTNGEKFDTSQMFATSKVLPLPSIARVTNLDNGKSVVVRVNNRGPFVNGRLLDVTPAAARQLGMVGQTKVRVQLMEPESRKVKELSMQTAPVVDTTVTEQAPVSTGPYTVQVGAYYSEESANSIAAKIQSIGNAQVIQESGMYKIRIQGLSGPAARTAIDRLRSEESMAPGLLKDGRWINADSI